MRQHTVTKTREHSKHLRHLTKRTHKYIIADKTHLYLQTVQAYLKIKGYDFCTVHLLLTEPFSRFQTTLSL